MGNRKSHGGLARPLISRPRACPGLYPTPGPPGSRYHVAFDMNQEKPITVVHIRSVSYSGSTWVNLLLASHSRAFTVGEMKRVVVDETPRCNVHPEGCEFWPRFDPKSAENPFLQVARLSGKDVIVVNNSRKLQHHQDHPLITSRYIHLMRDGRVVAASMMRKFKGMTMFTAARSWKRDVKRNRRILRRTGQPVHLALYEALQAEPEAQLRRLCDFIGLGYEPGMLQYWDKTHHFLGGNRGTLFSMLRHAGVKTAEEHLSANTKANWDLGHYKNQDMKNFTDERWKTELTPGQLRLFGLLAGRLNRSFGYPASTDKESAPKG